MKSGRLIVGSNKLCLKKYTLLSNLNNVEIGRSGSPHVDGDWIDESTPSEILNFLGHSGAEEQSLSLSFEVRENRANVFLKTHVNHTIGLVQAQIPRGRGGGDQRYLSEGVEN